MGDDLLNRLPAFDPGSGYLNVVIDTPKGFRNKFAYDPDRHAYILKTILPEGAVFPFDFGSIPGTRAPDGDALDVLILMDEPAFCGCLIEAKPIGVIKARQGKKGQKLKRNDRLIAVAVQSHVHRNIKTIKDLEAELVKEIEHFFVSYNAERHTRFKPLSRSGPKKAKRLVKKHSRRT